MDYNTTDWPALPPLSALVNKVHHMDALDLLALLPDASVDAVITDPPYGLGLDTWDLPIDIPAFLDAAYRVLKPNSFLAFTIQMPYMVDWLMALKGTDFRYKDHVVWVKRKHTNATTELCRSHESLLIYTKGISRYFETKGLWSDVKLPGYAHALMTIDGVDRYLKDVRAKMNGGASKMRHTGLTRHKSHIRMGNIGDTDRSPEFANFTNVWSFLPENTNHLNHGIYHHATMKPLKMFERLVELLTPAGAIVVDPYCGSGTTPLACRNTNRRYIAGDLSAEYVDVANRRLAIPYTPNMFDTLPAVNE